MTLTDTENARGENAWRLSRMTVKLKVQAKAGQHVASSLQNIGDMSSPLTPQSKVGQTLAMLNPPL